MKIKNLWTYFPAIDRSQKRWQTQGAFNISINGINGINGMAAVLQIVLFVIQLQISLRIVCIIG